MKMKGWMSDEHIRVVLVLLIFTAVLNFFWSQITLGVCYSRSQVQELRLQQRIEELRKDPTRAP